MSADRLAEIGRRAARLCYADPDAADCSSFCAGSCNAVCPADKYLSAASREVFAEYWDNHPANAKSETPLG